MAFRLNNQALGLILYKISGVTRKVRLGVKENNPLSVKWYRRAAEQGYPVAQSLLGAQYYHGEGVKRDYSKAISWYRKGAKQGDSVGQSNLGGIYIMGEGVPVDLVLGYAWSSLAATQGFGPGIHNERLSKRKLSSARLAEAVQIAKDLEQEIIAQKTPLSDLDSRKWEATTEECTPLTDSAKTARFNVLTLTLPDVGSWCYRGKLTSKRINPTPYSHVEFKSTSSYARVNLTNLEDIIFANAKQFLKFVKENKLVEQMLYPCWPKCKLKYSIDDRSGHSCIRFTQSFKANRNYIGMGHGRLCIHSGTPSILLSAEYVTETNKKPRGQKKKEIKAEAEEFLNSIKFTPN